MVDPRASIAKLAQRALRLAVRATGATDAQSRAALAASGSRVKVAIVMLEAGVDAAEAERRLDAASGSIAQALAG